MADIKNTWLDVWQHTPEVSQTLRKLGQEDHLSLDNMRCADDQNGGSVSV